MTDSTGAGDGPTQEIPRIEVRVATPDDLAAISSLIDAVTRPLLAPLCTAAELERWHASVRPSRLAELNRSGVRFFVAEVRGELAGVAALRDHHHVYHLYVEDRFRRIGVARRLWARLLLQAESEGAQALYVNAWVDAVPVYSSFGFIAVGSPTSSDGAPRQPMIRLPSGQRP